MGARIKERLSALNMKQADLYRKTGLSSNAVSSYVSGRRTPDTPALHRIAKAMETSMEWVLTGEAPTITDKQGGELRIPMAEKDGTFFRSLARPEIGLIMMFRALEYKNREYIFDTIHNMYGISTGLARSAYSSYFDGPPGAAME